MELNQLGSAKLGALMRTYCIPCILSLLVGALYNIVDQIFISNTPGLGSYGNAASTVVFPLTIIALAYAVMVGDGACAAISAALGSQEKERSTLLLKTALWMTGLGAVTITLVYAAFPDWLLGAFGGHVNEKTWQFSREYLFWINTGMIFYIIGQALNPIIRADGSPRFAMAATVCGALINCLLDPLFLFGFGWGMTGAAVATVIGQAFTALLSIGYLLRLKNLSLRSEGNAFSMECARRNVSLGMCSFLSQISLVAAMAAINSMIVRYSALDPVFSAPELTQIPMAVVGIVMKVFQIIISISIGLAAGSIPIVSYNMGARHFTRVSKLFVLLLGFVSLALVELFPGAISDLFGAAQENIAYRQFAIRSFRIYLCLLPLGVLNKGVFIFLQGMGKAGASTFLAMVRELVFGVGLALLLPRWFGLNGVLYSMPAADLLTFLISLAIIVSTLRQLHGLALQKEENTDPGRALAGA